MNNAPFRIAFRLVVISTTLALMGMATFAMSGCAAPYPSDPMDVFLNFSLTLADSDFDAAKTYCTNNFVDNEFDTAKSKMKAMVEKSDNKTFQSSVEGDCVKIWASGQESIKAVLINDAGKWKIDEIETKIEKEFTDEDAVNMMKGLGGVGSALGGKKK